MIILIENIKQSVDKKIYDQSLELVNGNQVKINRIELEEFDADVTDQRVYHVTVSERAGKIFGTCSCQHWNWCSHIVASLLAARKHYVKHRANMAYLRSHPSWKNFFSEIIAKSSSNIRNPLDQKGQIIFCVKLEADYWTAEPLMAIIKKDGKYEKIEKTSTIDLLNNDIAQASNEAIVMTFLAHYGNLNNAGMKTEHDHTYSGHHQHLLKYGVPIGNIFELLKEGRLYLNRQGSLEKLEVCMETVRVEFAFIDQRKDYQFLPRLFWGSRQEPLDSKFRVLTENPIWLLRGKQLIKVENINHAKLLVPFTKEDVTLTVPEKDLALFISTTFSVIAQFTELPKPQNYQKVTFSEITKKRLYLKESNHQLEVYLRFLYQDVELDFYDSQEKFYKLDEGKKVFYELVRNHELEHLAWQKLKTTGLKVSPKGYFHVPESKAIDWIMFQIPELVREFEIYGQENLKKYKVRTGYPGVSIGISTGIDWFDLSIKIDVEGISLSLQELKKAMTFQSRFVRLADGSMAQLPDNWYKKFLHLFNFARLEDRKIRISGYHITLIDQLCEQVDSIEQDQKYTDLISKIKNLKRIGDYALPPQINGILRPYQKAGYDWFYFLQELNFGGCLADDMGLGKTLQALTLLLNEKVRGIKIPSLIVCPTSVVFNWEREVEKFTPELRILRHTSVDRKKTKDSFESYDIILTSYGVMRQDIGFLKDFKFHYVILDESQKIKNPVSQTAKAARLLHSRYRLVLTGTPVENNTIELWSQFAFLNPGMLGNLAFFKRAFTAPIEKRKSEETTEYLKKLIFPFILRRNKESVASELPPKVEQTYYCPMNPAQHKLYIYWRDYYRARIMRRIDEIGLDRARFNILEGLVKLRLIASHPNLVDVTVWEDSGKFEILKDFVSNILAENHKIIIFSQFVKMLKLIRRYLDDIQIAYEYLDGHTRDREKCVNRFQTDNQVKIFLISLKAGGTGLNLTAADYVIHFDPWWNPAVEIQATDRAHRIGQDKKVFVYRFITKDSVEEKILELQQQKKELLSNLISTDISIFKSLTKENIEDLFS